MLGSQTEEKGARELLPPPKGSSQPGDGVGVRSRPALPSGLRWGQLTRPTFWAVPAQVHQHLICMAIHPLLTFPAPPEVPSCPEERDQAWVPAQSPSILSPHRGKDNGGGEKVEEGSGWPGQAVGNHCV